MNALAMTHDTAVQMIEMAGRAPIADTREVAIEPDEKRAQLAAPRPASM